jgi:hypothetical protein
MNQLEKKWSDSLSKLITNPHQDEVYRLHKAPLAGITTQQRWNVHSPYGQKSLALTSRSLAFLASFSYPG